MSIFNDNDDDLNLDDSVDYVDQLVGDGKKFKDVKELAKGKAEADRYIELLKTRLDEATKEINTRTSLDSFLKEIKTAKQPKPDDVIDPPVVDQKSGLDDSELEERLEKLIAQREGKKISQTNLQKVQTVVQENFGSNAKTVLTNKSKELGISLQRLEEIAAESPSAFYRLTGIEENRAPSGVAMPRSSISPSVAAASGIKNKAYFDKLKQSDPKKYFSPQTTVDMIRARQECESKGYSWE